MLAIALLRQAERLVSRSIKQTPATEDVAAVLGQEGVKNKATFFEHKKLRPSALGAFQ